MADKLPFIQFFTGDWKKDPGIQALDHEARGVWFEMLIIMHESDSRGKLTLNGNKMPDEALARLLGLDEAKTKQILGKILSYGVASEEQDTGIIYCRRMLRDIELRQKRADAGSKGGKQKSSNRKAKSYPSESEPESEPESYRTPTPPVPNEGHRRRFDRVWAIYPKKEYPDKAVQQFVIVNPSDADVDAMMVAIEEQKKSESWQRDGGRWIPQLSKWLAGGGWKNEANHDPNHTLTEADILKIFEDNPGMETDYKVAKINLLYASIPEEIIDDTINHIRNNPDSHVSIPDRYARRICTLLKQRNRKDT